MDLGILTAMSNKPDPLMYLIDTYQRAQKHG
jgi:hypothetical protein